MTTEHCTNELDTLQSPHGNITGGIAVVRCETVSEVCPGTGCLGAFFDRRSHFSGYDGSTRLLGFFTCGGCSGRRVVRLLKKLKKHRVEAVHLSSCMKSSKHHPGCPFIENIKDDILSLGLEVVEGTHH